MPFGVMASGKLTAEDGRLSPWLYLAQPGLIIASTGLTPGRGGPPFGYPKARTVSQFNEETPGPSVRMHRSGPVIARLPKFSSLGWGPRSSPPKPSHYPYFSTFPYRKEKKKSSAPARDRTCAPSASMPVTLPLRYRRRS